MAFRHCGTSMRSPSVMWDPYKLINPSIDLKRTCLGLNRHLWHVKKTFGLLIRHEKMWPGQAIFSSELLSALPQFFHRMVLLHVSWAVWGYSQFSPLLTEQPWSMGAFLIQPHLHQFSEKHVQPQDPVQSMPAKPHWGEGPAICNSSQSLTVHGKFCTGQCKPRYQKYSRFGRVSSCQCIWTRSSQASTKGWWGLLAKKLLLGFTQCVGLQDVLLKTELCCSPVTLTRPCTFRDPN